VEKSEKRPGANPDILKSRTPYDLTSSMVGRDMELEALCGFADRLAHGVGGVIHVQGPSGIGKSRLVEEFIETRITGRFTLLTGRALSIGHNLALHPFVPVIRSWAGINEAEQESTTASKLSDALSALSIEDPERIFPFISAVIGLRSSESPALLSSIHDGEARETLIFKHMRTLVAGIAANAPVVILLEDFQCADRSSINLLKYLCQLIPDNPILFLIASIPEVEPHTDLIRTITDEISPEYSLTLVLEPLEDSDSHQLVSNLLGNPVVPEDVFQHIIHQARGNPLYLVEAVRHLVDEGVIVKKDDVLTVTDKIQTIAFPDTLKDLLKFRLSRLNDDTQDLIKTASVMEKTIMSRVLDEITSVSGDTRESDEGFRRFASLYRESTEAHDHLLVHTLGQETAYESMHEDQKRGLHLRVADTIERIYYHRLHEFFGVLAYHYGVAGADVKAKQYLVKAGSEAMETAAFTEALHCFQEALTIHHRQPAGMRDRDEEIFISKNLAVCLYYLGRYEESLSYFRDVLAEWGEREPTTTFGRTVRFLVGFTDFLISMYIPKLRWRRVPTERDQEFIRFFYMKSSALANIDSIRFLFESFYFARRFVNFDITHVQNGIAMFAGYSAVFSWTGASFTLSEKVLSFVQKKLDGDDIRSKMYFEITDMIHNFFTGRWDENVFDDSTLRSNLASGEIMNTVNYLTLHAQFAIEKGDGSAAEKMLNALHEVASMYNNTYAWAYWHALRIKKLMKSRLFLEVLDSIDEALAYLKKHDLKILLNLLHATKAQAQALTGDFPGSAFSLSCARQYEESIERLPYYRLKYIMAAIIHYLYLLENSETAEQKKAKSEIDTYIRKARRLVRCDASARTDLFRLIGSYYWISGRCRKAYTSWNRSIKEGESLGALPDLAHTYEEVGRRVAEQEGPCGNEHGIDPG